MTAEIYAVRSSGEVWQLALTMAKRAAFLVVLLCVAIAGAVLPAPVAASRKLSRGMASFAIRAWCIPKTESILEEHEGRHSCVYNLTNGDRAVGVGYNLDDDKETRRSEMSTVLADYDKVSRPCSSRLILVV